MTLKKLRKNIIVSVLSLVITIFGIIIVTKNNSVYVLAFWIILLGDIAVFAREISKYIDAKKDNSDSED